MLNRSVYRSIPRNVWVLGCVSLFADVNSKMIQSTLPLFLVSVLGANLATVGLIEGIAESTASVFKVFSGALSDYWGRRKELAIVGYGLSTLVTPIFALATTSGWVLTGRFADRLGKGIRVAPRNALVADATPAQYRGAAFGLRQSLDTVGAFSGPLLAAALLWGSGQNFRFVFWLAFIPGVLGVLLLILGVQEPAKSASFQKNPLQWSALKNLGRDYWILAVVALLFNLGNSSDAFLLLRAQQLGIATPLIPLAFVVINLTYGISAYPIGVLSDRIGRLGLLMGGFLIFALVYAGFAFAQTPWQIWVLFGCYGLYLGSTQGLLLALVADRVSADLRGTAFGLINLVIGIALLPASLLAGILWQQVGSAATFLMGSGFAVAATIGLSLFKPRR
ncbi:MAG: MFS transporter [Cyanobacteria bacterium CRU_2_1]|nr:MFS transporter [Cyanobacteria bacterium CRU_2_1]